MKAKLKLKNLLSFLLAFVMVVALIPATTAMAEEPKPEDRTANFVDAPTVALALLNTYKTGTEESTWDVTTNTLTLNGVNFETTANTALSLPEGSTIILHGENTINGVGSSNDPYKICYGIFVNNSYLTIKGDGKLTVTGGKSASHSFGISAYVVKIEGGDVTAIGGTATAGDSCGISSVSIRGGKLTAKGGKAANNSIGCLNAYMTGGTLIATGETAALSSSPTDTNTHWWRISNSAPYYSSSDSNYTWDKSHKYVEIRDTNPGDNITVAKVVNNIAVTFTAPELGVTPDYSPEYVSTPENGVKYSEDYPTCTWYKIAKADFKGTYEDPWDEMESGEAFKTGYYYLVEMFLDTNIGYKISETTNGTVNGMPHYNDIYYGENNSAYLCGMFVPLHEHTSGTEWKSDSNNHWHICTADGCGVIIEDSKAAHAIGDWVTGKKATDAADGIMNRECTACHYVMETAKISHIAGVKPGAVKYTYSGSVKTPSVKVTDADGNVLVKDTDYSVAYPTGRKAVGKYTVKIVFKGNYEGTKSFSFTIKPKTAKIKSITATSRKLTVKAATKVSATGGTVYQIAYKQKGTSTWKYTTTTSYYKTIKSLKKGKQYYVKMRAYRKSGTTKYYGSWSTVKLSKAVK